MASTGTLISLGPHPLDREVHRLDDRLIARAAADVPAERVDDLVFARRRLAGQQLVDRHHEPGRAETALEPVLLEERLLDRVQRAAVREALDGLDLGAVGLD